MNFSLLSRIRYFFLVMLVTGMTPLAFASATVLLVKGDVLMTPKTGSAGKIAEGQRIETGAQIKTSANSTITFRFDDGQMVALTSNTTYVIDEYRFNPHKPAEGGLVASLLKGGMRTVTGLIGKTNPEEIKVKTPVATVGIRGTDYELFVEGRMFISVREGAIGVVNSQGETVFDGSKQTLGIVPDAQTKARPALLSEFSADAVAAMRRLDIDPHFGTRVPNPNDPSCSDRR